MCSRVDLTVYYISILQCVYSNCTIIIFQAMVYLMGYGGHYELPISVLAPLPEQFQLFPFQMLHCCFSDQFALTFGREVGACVCVRMHVCCMSNLFSLLSSPLLFFCFSLLYLSYSTIVRQDRV